VPKAFSVKRHAANHAVDAVGLLESAVSRGTVVGADVAQEHLLKWNENVATWCVRMPMRSRRERIMEREVPESQRKGAPEIRTEARNTDKWMAGKIGEGIHDAARGRLLPLQVDEAAGRSVRTTNLVGE
jgi:hypothetical protein